MVTKLVYHQIAAKSAEMALVGLASNYPSEPRKYVDRVENGQRDLRGNELPRNLPLEALEDTWSNISSVC